MPHVPNSGRSRTSHRGGTRSTHGYDGYMAGLLQHGDVYDQVNVDGTVGPGDIPPGTIDGNGAIIPHSFTTLTPFADTIRPVAVVAALPALPDEDYPEGATVVLTSDGKLYRNFGGVWTDAVAAVDITGQITETQISDLAISTPKLAANAVTAGKIAANTITANEVAANTLTAGQIAAGAISTDELAANAVTTAKLATGEITLYGPDGETILEPEGFGPTWRRFIQSGFYNGDFYAPTAVVANNIHNTTNPLPKWSFVQASGTAITAKSVADAGNGSGYAVQFAMVAGAANDNSYLEQIVPLLSSQNRGFTFSAYMYMEAVASHADYEAWIEVQYLKRDLTTTGSASLTAIASTSLTSSVEIGEGGGPPPADAYFARVRFGTRRKAAGSNAATGTVQLHEVFVIRGNPRNHIAEIGAPATYNRGIMLQNQGSLYLAANALGVPHFTAPQVSLESYDATHTQLGTIGLKNAALLTGGTAFPGGTRDTDEVFYRTDLRMWFFYDGTRWLSEQLFRADMEPAKGEAATFTQYGVAFNHNMGGSDIWIEDYGVSFFVNGGTALAGAHKWVGVIGKTLTGNTDTTVATVNIDSGASTTWRETSGTIDALRGTTFYNLRIIWTKTGTPGTLFATAFVTYRIVAT